MQLSCVGLSLSLSDRLKGQGKTGIFYRNGLTSTRCPGDRASGRFGSAVAQDRSVDGFLSLPRRLGVLEWGVLGLQGREKALLLEKLGDDALPEARPQRST